MLVIVDDMLLYILLSLALMFFAITGILAILLLKAPQQVRQLIGIWLRKQVLDIAATDHHSFKFLGWKAREEGQLERKHGRLVETKVIPRGNPLAADIFHLDSTGIPCVLSYEGKTIATGPDALLAMKVAESDKDELPKEIQELAKLRHVEIKQWKIEKGDDGREKQVLEILKHTLFSLNPLLLKAYASDWFDMNQFTHMREESRLEGKYEGLGLRRKGAFSGKTVVLIGVVIVVAAIALLFLVSSGVIK